MHITSSGFPAASVRAQIAEAIDIYVHLARTPDGHRRVIEIAESAGIQDGEIVLNPLFIYDPQNGLVSSGSELRSVAKLQMRGLYAERKGDEQA